MGCDAKFFSNNVAVADVLDYLKNTYEVNYNGIEKNSCFSLNGYVGFMVDGEQRNVFVFVDSNTYENDDEYSSPEKPIPNKALTLMLSSDEQSIDILTKIAKQFGGYVCENDCGDSNAPDFWKKYSSDTTYNNTMEKLYAMLASDYQDGNVKNLPSAIALAEFIDRHKEEIKNL